MKKVMNILCASDRNFLHPTYVFMQSVMENHEGIQVNFYLLAGEDISEDEKAELKAFIESRGCIIEYLYINSDYFNGFVLHEKFPRSAYYRLMAHSYLPSDMDRILYLDVDIILDKNIYDDFYLQDFNGKYLVATSHNPDPSFFNTLTPHTVNLESAARGEFFNSGVLLMNLELFRKNVTIDDYNHAYESCEKSGFEIFYDQGLLNYMFYDKTLYFSSMDYNYRFSIPKQYENRLEEGREYKKSVIHFTGMCQPYKPWDLMLEEADIEKFGEVPFSSEYFYVSHELDSLLRKWWDYARNTPVYDDLYSQMKIKQKWFKRQLMDFMLDHNKQIASGVGVSVVDGKTKVVYKNIDNLPKNFHWRAYKLGCFICAPLIAVKRWLRRNKH